MKTSIMVCMLVTLAAANPQSALAQVHPAANMQQNEQRSEQMQSQELQNNKPEDYARSLVKLNELRAKLAEAWQTLGLSPQAAHAVANAYQPDSVRSIPEVDLRGKSRQEVAAILQSALAKKDYMLANQTLIEFHKMNAKSTASASTESQR